MFELAVGLVVAAVLALGVGLPLLVRAADRALHRSLGHLATFCLELEDASLEEGADEEPLLRLAGTRVEGTLEGRQVGLRFELRQVGRGKQLVSHYRVAVPHAVGEMEIAPAGLAERLGRRLGLGATPSTGHGRVDDEYTVQGTSKAVEQAFARGLSWSELDRLFRREGFQRLRLEGGHLTAERPTWFKNLEPRRLRRTLRFLGDLADLCARREVRAERLGEGRHYAWTGGGPDPRCPFCHDALDLEGPDLAACPACRTVHHAGCWAEAGCTVLGCAERRSPAREGREPG